MKWIILSFLFVTSAWAENSKFVPTVLEAARLYISGEARSQETLYVRPDIRAALEIFEKAEIDPALLERRLSLRSTIALRADDRFDRWAKEPTRTDVIVPEMAVQAFKLDVIENSDWLKDDIYVYFFITDGVIPTGKVTSIYKGLGSGQGFFFNEIDRAIFPLTGVSAKRPENHLIIDYGIIESDGDDIKELQKLSAIIIDIAISVYAAYDPQNAQLVVNLRKEIKALADLLISMNNDDRMATGSFGYKVVELEAMLKDQTYAEITKKHKGGKFSKWEYDLSFRFLRK